MPKKYPRDFRERAVRLVIQTRPEYVTEWPAIRQVATGLGVGPERVRNCVCQAEVNAWLRPDVSESGNAEIRRLKKKVTELKRANEILQTASAFFGSVASTDPRLNVPICRFVS